MGEVGHAIYGRVQAILDSGCHPISPVCLHANQAFARRCFCTQVLLHREGPSHRDGLKKEMILQRDASTRRCSYTEMLSTSLNTEMPLHTGALGGKYFYTETILQRESFRRRHVYTGAFTQICFYTQLFLRTNTFTQCCRVQVLLRRDCFMRKYFYTDIL